MSLDEIKPGVPANECPGSTPRALPTVSIFGEEWTKDERLKEYRQVEKPWVRMSLVEGDAALREIEIGHLLFTLQSAVDRLKTIL